MRKRSKEDRATRRKIILTCFWFIPFYPIVRLVYWHRERKYLGSCITLIKSGS